MKISRKRHARHRLEERAGRINGYLKNKSILSVMVATLAITGGLQLAEATASSADINQTPLNAYLHIPLTIKRPGGSTIVWGAARNVPAHVVGNIRKALDVWATNMNNPNLFREARPGEQVGFQFQMDNLGYNAGKVLGRAPYIGCSGPALHGCLNAKLDNVLAGFRDEQVISVVEHEFGHALHLNHSVNGRPEEIMLAWLGNKPSVRPTSDEAVMANHLNGGLLGNPKPDNPRWPRLEFGNERGWDPKSQSWVPYAEWSAKYGSTPYLRSDGWFGYDPKTNSYIPRTNWEKKYGSATQDAPDPTLKPTPDPKKGGRDQYDRTQFYAQTTDGNWRPLKAGSSPKGYVNFMGYGLTNGAWQDIKDPLSYLRRAEHETRADPATKPDDAPKAMGGDVSRQKPVGEPKPAADEQQVEDQRKADQQRRQEQQVEDQRKADQQRRQEQQVEDQRKADQQRRQ
ncbi:hypothetical protein ABZ624_41630, partial [Streptomyces sp. NPDC007205]